MKSNLQYWKTRAKARVEDYTADVDKISAELGKAYYAAERMLKEESRKVFKGFQNAFNLSKSEAKRLVDNADVALPSKAVKSIIDGLSDPEIKNQLLAYLSAPAYQYRMKRLDNLAKSADKICKQLYTTELRTDTAYFATEIDKAYKHLIFDIQQGTGTYGAFNQIPQSRIQEILKHDWSGEHYSKRIWGNTQDLAETLKQNMIESFLTGESEQKAAARIQQRFKVGFNEARRLIRTDNTFITNQAELEGYNEAEIEEYTYMAVMDNDTSDECRELNGKSFKVKNAKPGVNLPPMHPWCRSTTIGKLPSEEELDAMWDKDMAEYVPEGLTFDEWLDGLQPTEDGKLVYTGKLGKTFNDNIDNSTKSGIIDDESISNVPFTLLDVYSDSECETIQRINKDLLDFVRNEPVGTEAIAYYGEKLNEINRHIGTSGKVLPVNGIKEKHYIVHNHPSNRTFSPDDLKLFAEDSSAAVLCAQGNNGKYQYFVEKLENYQEISFYIACLDLEKEIYAIADDISLSFEEKVSKAEKIMEEFLNGADKYGVKYIERKN